MPENESQRLEYLEELDVLDARAEPGLDDVARLASEICDTPIALISLIDSQRQIFKSKIGIDSTETPGDFAFCAHAILQRDLFVVEDALQDQRFHDHPSVTAAPFIRFYAGAPLVTPEGLAVGTLCVLDRKPRQLTERQSKALLTLARQVEQGLRLRRSALHDALTGLANRELFADRVSQCLDRARRDRKNLFAVLFLDLDRFRIINDSLGHAAGDVLLKTVAGRLRQCLCGCDCVAAKARSLARMGGDAFMALLDGIKHPFDAGIVAERILQALAEPINFEGHELRPTASIGIVVSGGDNVHASAEVLLRDADTAMYRAKSEGKNRICVFDSAMHDAAMSRLRLETDLRHAVARQEFVLHFQPSVSLASGQIDAFEALIRWNHHGQIINPMDFIPVAQDLGLIIEMGRWVIGEALRQLAAWRQADPAMPRIAMSINLSGKQLADPQLLACMYDALAVHSIAATDLVVELTEAAMIENGECRQMLDGIKLMGVRISLDDFGTGVSSLSCLHKFPIDFLKIDPSFIENLAEKRDVEAVVHAVIALAHNLGVAVIAEGLETDEQVEYMRSLGCDFAQGYHFSKPLTAEAAQAFIATAGLPAAA